MRKINKLIIHCSDTDDSLDFGVKDIRQWHLQRGFSDVGYHYVIRRNGKVESGRDIAVAGAHVSGHNKDSIGICWVGRNQISKEQFAALKGLTQALASIYGLDVTEDVYGHKEFNPHKTCPNLDMDLFRAELIFK